jgi:hypothetical protein
LVREAGALIAYSSTWVDLKTAKAAKAALALPADSVLIFAQ